MKRYESYKDSEVEWIGKIPENWKIAKFKHIGKLIGRIGFRGYTVDDIVEKGFGAISLSPSNIFEQKLTLETCTYISWFKYEESPEIKIYPKDITIVKTGSTIGKVAIIPEDMPEMTLNPQLVVLKDIIVEPKFLYYLMISRDFQSLFQIFSMGGSTPAISQEKINNFPIAFPKSLEDQTQIARYLDQKTTQIDKLIADKRKLIALLNEERTAMINQAVTKGLNPNVPMKDSGVEWLGEIPAHWEVKKMKHVVSKIGSGVTPKGGAEVYVNNGIPFIRSQNIYFDGFRTETIAYITEEVHNSMSNSKVLTGDVLLNITGGSIGRSFYVTDEFTEANVNQHVCIIRPNAHIETVYLFNLIRSSVIQEQIENCQTGGNRESVNFDQLKNFVFPLPGVEERLSIVKTIKSESKRINFIISNIKTEMDLLKEYKTALISEVVTGKVDVRGEVLN